MRKKSPHELRELRLQTGLTIAEVCRLTGVLRQTWEKWEMSSQLSSSRRPSDLAFAWLDLYLKTKDYLNVIEKP